MSRVLARWPSVVLCQSPLGSRGRLRIAQSPPLCGGSASTQSRESARIYSRGSGAGEFAALYERWPIVTNLVILCQLIILAIES